MSDGSMWFEEPYVESRMRERAVSSGRPGLFYKPFSFQESFQPHNQVNDGKGFKNNQEWAEHNIKTFKQIQALVTGIFLFLSFSFIFAFFVMIFFLFSIFSLILSSY